MSDDDRDMREVTLYDDDALKLMEGWWSGQGDPLYAIYSMGGRHEAWVFERAISNLNSDIAKVHKIGRNQYQLGKGTFKKREIQELFTMRDALEMALAEIGPRKEVGGAAEARTRWPDWMVLEAVAMHHMTTPQADERARELAAQGFIDTSGTWKLTAKGRKKLDDEAPADSAWKTKRPRGKEAREVAPVLHEPTTAPVLHERSAQVPTCLPWVKVTRDVEKYEACLAQAKKLGPINNARKVYDLLHKTLDERDEECFLVVLLDVRQQLRGVAEVARGQRSRVSVAVADIMRAVITSGAELFVIAHCHPSGNCEPSDEDKRLTTDVEEACKPYGGELTFADHVVIGLKEFYSIKEGAKYTV